MASSPLAAVRHTIAPIARRAGFRSGLYGALRRLLPSRALAILRYHAVVEPRACWYAAPGICVSPAAFERHVAYLTARYSVRSLPHIVEAVATGAVLPDNVVAFTFDDGYADNLLAARILAKYGASGTFYITAGCLKGEAAFWPTEVRVHAQALAGRDIELMAGATAIRIENRNAGHVEPAARALSKLFKSHSVSVRDDLTAQLRRQSGIAPPKSPMLTWDELREMHALGMTIGAHTITHANLPSAGLEVAGVEIRESRRLLEVQLNAPVTMFSYPNGGADLYYTPDIQQLVREAGYHAATTSRNGFATRASDLFALERVKTAESLEDLVFALEVERFAFQPSSVAVLEGAP
jgi:peptidoglycan/xylan/chitin deacetylase (PgdA/CDA1 family)